LEEKYLLFTSYALDIREAYRFRTSKTNKQASYPASNADEVYKLEDIINKCPGRSSLFGRLTDLMFLKKLPEDSAATSS